MQSPQNEAIVVGSGISTGWAAKELTEGGLRVLMLERGKNVGHVKDQVNATQGPWEYPYRGRRSRAMEEAYPVETQLPLRHVLQHSRWTPALQHSNMP